MYGFSALLYQHTGVLFCHGAASHGEKRCGENATRIGGDIPRTFHTAMASKGGHGPKHSKLDAAEFASNQLSLLEKERLAEVAEVSDAITTFSPSQLQARGLALLNLVIDSVRTGLGGRTYIFMNDCIF